MFQIVQKQTALDQALPADEENVCTAFVVCHFSKPVNTDPEQCGGFMQREKFLFANRDFLIIIFQSVTPPYSSK